MVREKPKAVTNVREHFSTELRSVMERRQIHAQPDSFQYLVNLMVHYMDAKTFFTRDEQGKNKTPVLFDIYSQYLQGDAETKRVALRRLGDISLVVAGFFPDSLNRSLVDLDYYYGMGGTAYATLSKLQFHTLAQSLFMELSVKFRSFADLMNELSERSGLQNNRDLLRLYEKWLLTGSDRLKDLLGEHGIAPHKVDLKARH